MGADLTDFGRAHSGEADLGDKRRTDRLVRVAGRVAAHPSGSLPHETHSPPAELAARTASWPGAPGRPPEPQGRRPPRMADPPVGLDQTPYRR